MNSELNQSKQQRPSQDYSNYLNLVTTVKVQKVCCMFSRSNFGQAVLQKNKTKQKQTKKDKRKTKEKHPPPKKWAVFAS